MKFSLEEHFPYVLLALLVLAMFYGIYFGKMLVQKQHGIRTHQIGRRKEKGLHTVETLMSIATLGAPGRTAFIHCFGWNWVACKRPFHRILHRNAGRCCFPAFCSVHEG